MDEDFGSGGAVLLPDQAGPTPHELLAAGKEGKIYVIDRDDMGHFDPDANHVVQELPGAIGGLWGSPGVFDGTAYFGGVGDVLKAFALRGTGRWARRRRRPRRRATATRGRRRASRPTGPSAGIVWALDTTAYGSGGPAVLHAYDAADLGSELYTSAASGARDQAAGAVKFAVPTVANGKVYVGGQYALTIYGSIVGLSVPAAPSALSATASATRRSSCPGATTRRTRRVSRSSDPPTGRTTRPSGP